jgi:hypothetical protein
MMSNSTRCRRSALFLTAAAALLCVALLTGCSGKEGQPQITPTAVPSLGPTDPPSTSPATPPTVRRVADALVAGDASVLVSMLVYQPRSCVEPPGPGEVPCPSGSATGTAVSVMPVGGCRSNWLSQSAPADSKAAFIASLLGTDQPLRTTVRAIALPSTTPTDIESGTKYYVIAARQAMSDRPALIGVGDAGVTFISTGCGTTVEEFVRRFTNFLD